MLVFIVLLAVPLLLQYGVVGNTHIDFEKKNKRALMFFFIILTLILMFRHASVGNDTRNYIRLFQQISFSDWSELNRYTTEVGFVYLCKFISVISDNPQFFLSIVSVIVCACLSFTYTRLCKEPSLTIILFCNMATFVMMFSGIRQMLAIAIGLVAYECTQRKKLFWFIVSVLFAMFFHTSAFILAFMYPLYHAKITKKWMFVIVPLLTTIFIFNKRIFSFLLIILSRFTEYEGEITATGAYTMLFLFIAFAVFSFLVPNESLLDEETRGLRNFLLFSCVIQFFAPVHTLAMRMNYYYIIFIPLLLPRIIAYRSIRYKQIAVIGRYVMLGFFLVYFFASANGDGNLHVFPYHFFWEVIS